MGHFDGWAGQTASAGRIFDNIRVLCGPDIKG